MWKKVRTAVFLLAVTVSAGLLISPYLDARPLLPPPTASATTSGANIHILHQDDVVQPDHIAHIVIKAPDTAEVGELVRFDLSASAAQSYKWILVPESVDFETYRDGEAAVFSARKPGEYMFIVACAYNGSVDVATHIVTVGGGTPYVPDVSKPDAVAGIDKWAVYWCSTNELPSDEAERLAGSFEAVSAQIAAGILQEADEIVAATADANRKALGDSLSDWLPVLRELQAVMREKAEQGELSTPDQHRVLWKEIAEGLRNYASLVD
jgi:hypothetical protein